MVKSYLFHSFMLVIHTFFKCLTSTQPSFVSHFPLKHHFLCSHQKSCYMWFMWSNYVKLEILYKSVAQFSIINTETILHLQKAIPPWSVIQAWNNPSFPPMTIEENETSVFGMVKLNKLNSIFYSILNCIHRITLNSMDTIPSGTLWKDQEIMNSKLCVLTAYKIKKYILTYSDFHIFFTNTCCLSCTKCYVHVILSLALLFPQNSIKECAFFFISIIWHTLR